LFIERTSFAKDQPYSIKTYTVVQFEMMFISARRNSCLAIQIQRSTTVDLAGRLIASLTRSHSSVVAFDQKSKSEQNIERMRVDCDNRRKPS